LKEEERRQKELLLAKLKSSGMSDDEIQKLRKHLHINRS
jgi:hypothetical protein